MNRMTVSHKCMLDDTHAKCGDVFVINLKTPNAVESDDGVCLCTILDCACAHAVKISDIECEGGP